MNLLSIGLLLLQAQLSTASGTVTKAGNNEPVAGATVLLNPATLPQGTRANVDPSQAARIRLSTTEDDGRFTITDIEPGEYRLQIQSPLYGGVAYGQRRPDGPGALVTISAGQRLTDLKVSMTPTGTIAGRVTGRSGEPLAYAAVQALKYAYQDGKRILTVAQATTTDDHGDYRLIWLYSGQYLVVASARTTPANPLIATPPMRPGGTILASDLPFRGPLLLNPPAGLMEGTNLVKRISGDGSIREESWLPTYYPATTDRTTATAIDVVATSTGSTVTGIDITLAPSAVQKIRGRVIGGSQATVSLADNGQGTLGQVINKNVSPIDGSFEFSGVLPGPYVLSAQDRSGLLSSRMPVLVADRDVENLAIGLSPGIPLSVLVSLEGVPPELWDSYAPLVAMLRSEFDRPFGVRAPMKPGAPSAFAPVPPGDYEFDISLILRNDRKPLHIKSLRVGREDALNRVHLTSDTKDPLLQVVLTTETGSVEGIAIGRAGDPAANCTVVLVPEYARMRASLYKTLVTNSDGRFRFQEIPPGNYKLFAWDDIETGAWQDAEFMRPYESRGRAIRISENGKEEAQLNVIYNP